MIIYAICLVVGLVFTIGSAVAGHFFGGHGADAHADIGTGGHAEAGFDSSGIPGISFFSPTVLSAFVTAFGALGLIFSKIELTQNVWISAPLSAVGALVIALLILWMFNFMFHQTQGSSESKVASLPGMTATLITPITENGVGEVAYVQGNSRYTAPVRSEDGHPIACGQPVVITRVVGTQFFVKKI